MRRLLRCLFVSAGLIALLAISALCQATPRQPGELAWAIHYDPATFDPAKVDEQASALVRYLTGGVLLRLNRQTQEPEPQLAESFQVSAEGTSMAPFCVSAYCAKAEAAESSMKRLENPGTVWDIFLHALRTSAF